MMMYVRALGGLLLVDCMLYGALRLLLGKRRKLAGSIALYALFLPVFAGTVGLLGADLSQTFADELQIYSALWNGFLQKGQAFLNALTSPEKTTAQALTIVAMLVVIVANLGIVLHGIPSLMEDGEFDWSMVTDMEDFFVQSLALYPVVALLTVLGWALMVAVDVGLCIGLHWLLYGVLPW